MESTTSSESTQHRTTPGEAKGEVFDCDEVQTEVFHLVKDEKHEHEKPYEVRYDNGGAVPRTNIVQESKPISVRNFRPLETKGSFEEYGFASAKLDCSMTAAEFDDDRKVEAMYYPAVEKLLKECFPDVHEVKILEHGVSNLVQE